MISYQTEQLDDNEMMITFTVKLFGKWIETSFRYCGSARMVDGHQRRQSKSSTKYGHEKTGS